MKVLILKTMPPTAYEWEGPIYGRDEGRSPEGFENCIPIQYLFIGCIPNFGFSAGDYLAEAADGDAEVAGFKAPVAVGTNEGKVGSRKLETHFLALTGLQGNLFKAAEALDVGDKGGHQVRAVEEDSFLTGAGAGVGDGDGDLQDV